MQTQKNESVVGVWNLESFVIEDPKGNQTTWGKNLRGLLIYTGSGHVSVSINKDLDETTTDEYERIFHSILFYSGTYQEDGNRILHQVTHASNPMRIGKEQIRFAEMIGDKLRLVTPTESFGRGILIWRRVQTNCL